MLVFVAGVHGVGKGTLCRRIADALNIKTYSASSLIKDLKKGLVDQDKMVIDASDNQDYLVEAVKSLDPSELSIIDGHFCLQSVHGIYEVPISTFENLAIDLIVVIKNNPKVIESNLNSRDGKSFSADEIEAHQNQELIRSEYVCQKLNLNRLVITPSEYASLEGSISKLLAISV